MDIRRLEDVPVENLLQHFRIDEIQYYGDILHYAEMINNQRIPQFTVQDVLDILKFIILKRIDVIPYDNIIYLLNTYLKTYEYNLRKYKLNFGRILIESIFHPYYKEKASGELIEIATPGEMFEEADKRELLRDLPLAKPAPAPAKATKINEEYELRYEYGIKKAEVFMFIYNNFKSLIPPKYNIMIYNKFDKVRHYIDIRSMYTDYYKNSYVYDLLLFFVNEAYGYHDKLQNQVFANIFYFLHNNIIIGMQMNTDASNQYFDSCYTWIIREIDDNPHIDFEYLGEIINIICDYLYYCHSKNMDTKWYIHKWKFCIKHVIDMNLMKDVVVAILRQGDVHKFTSLYATIFMIEPDNINGFYVGDYIPSETEFKEIDTLLKKYPKVSTIDQFKQARKNRHRSNWNYKDYDREKRILMRENIIEMRELLRELYEKKMYQASI